MADLAVPSLNGARPRDAPEIEVADGRVVLWGGCGAIPYDEVSQARNAGADVLDVLGLQREGFLRQNPSRFLCPKGDSPCVFDRGA